ncbi:flavin reductase family protein [Hirschia litorea]|uniref:Flavin reductase family protein n=1 Tax=Hirschia litorea TaxID=1199156 RepID=A0ABW2INZ4_9PROT
MASFKPETDTKAFRNALGRFATGVTVITANGPDGPIGMTANSFTSLSLEPALVMWSPAKKSSRYEAFVNAPHFAIHILAHDQKEICNAFARSKSAFDQFEVTHNLHDVPVFSGCLAVFECKRFAVHDAGDHSIIVGEVEFTQEREGTGLVFSQGAFGAINPLQA